MRGDIVGISLGIFQGYSHGIGSGVLRNNGPNKNLQRFFVVLPWLGERWVVRVVSKKRRWCACALGARLVGLMCGRGPLRLRFFRPRAGWRAVSFSLP